MERELVMSGIGGQGIQLASSVLASAALAEKLEVQLFGSYGGMMRGGATEATLVIGDGSIEAPPTVSASWSVILMHHEYSEHALSTLRSGSVLFVDGSVIDPRGFSETSDVTLIEVPATSIAVDAGHAVAASMVMIGAYAAVTGIVGISALTEAARAALPPYRSQHAQLNDRAIAEGASCVRALSVPAWVGDALASGTHP
jgi:Pyruvate/2-oxoacid:ferredoxin oxidoreductase gamma subunit